MKLALMITVAVIGVANAQGKSAPGPQIRVYLRENAAAVPLPVRARAQSLASDMFANIGISLKWRSGNPSPSENDSIAIHLTSGTPESFRPGALAFALPYEGVHIRIFWDRIALFHFATQVLAHVMVHEITHILQGIAEHSDEGIMKAQWTRGDLIAMAVAPLRFTPADVDRIYSGMENRGIGTLLAGAPRLRSVKLQ